MEKSEKLENCEVCAANKAKYTCPKCEVRTCCLTCVNIHKKELKCDGIRDKAKYIPLKSFTDLDLLSDYRFLETVGRSVEKFKGDQMKRCTRQTELPLHLRKLKGAANHNKVNLLFMPHNFGRNKRNTTFLKWKTNELFWRIEWIFPQAENIKWVIERALDTIRLSELLERVLNPVDTLEDKSDMEELNFRLSLRERLQFYRAAGVSGMKVLLKAEKVAKSDFRFYELDPTLSLKDNFENKTIIEFPTLYVILKHHSDMYEIIDTDDEEVSDTPCIKRRKVYKQEKKETHAPVNYFFNMDLSDSEDESEKQKKNNKKINAPNLDIPDYNQLVKLPIT